MNQPKLTPEESARRHKIIRRYWTAVAIIKMCCLAGEYSNEINDNSKNSPSVDLCKLSEALNFAFEELDEIGLEMCPLYGGKS